MKIYNFRGGPTDISAKNEALLASIASTLLSEY